MNRQILIGLSLAVFAGTAAAVPLQIEVAGLRKDQGQLLLKLVDSVEAYDGKGKSVAGEKRAASGTSQSFSFDVPAGRYAVMVVHDENDNGKMDSNILGIPSEAYGFSNNPRVMRKPTFEETAFELPADGASIKIELN